MKEVITGFTLRVYGFLENENGEVLLLSENIGGKPFNKFPGGGVELGEGIKAALIREFKEELNLDIEVNKHIYTTDFFVQSAFYPQYQVIAVYYSVICANFSGLMVLDPEIESIRWVKKESASEDNISLETDRIAFNRLHLL